MANIDYASVLNPEQCATVLSPDGYSLALAAAGTGKTRTLVHRVAHLVERGVDAERILLLTFTNKAAREMLQRARALVGDRVSGLWGGTFHHMANRLLRRHAGLLGYPSEYAILDSDDSQTLMRQCVHGLNLRGMDFPKPSVLLSVASWAANTEASLEYVVDERFGQRHSTLAADPGDVLRVVTRYQQRKTEMGAMDFDDLLVNALRLLREHPEVAHRYGTQFLHVLVDEYQDTNRLQAEVVDRLARVHGNVLVVGDDFQSIYSWRGADYRNILTFPERHPGSQVYKLETNYRSVPEILAVANACIAGNPQQFQKTMRAVRGSGRRPRLARLRDGGDQARWVLRQVESFRRSGVSYDDMAVLYRAHYHAMELQLELTREHVPYAITSGVRFFEQAHIKDVLALLRLAACATDELAFLRLFGMLPGVGPRTVEKVWEAQGRRVELLDPAVRHALGGALPKGARAAWSKIADIFPADPAALSGAGLAESFIEAFYTDHAVATYEDAPRRLEDVREMMLYMERFDSLGDFLNDAALLTNLDAEAGRDEANAGPRVRLSTVHQAKGLEWKVVFVLSCNEGMFPSQRSVDESADGEAEERRLFYVAVTRAEDDLVLCVPEVRRVQGGGAMYVKPSRFVEEIPKGLLQAARVTAADW